MIIFIDDRPIKVISQKKAKSLTATDFEHLIDAKLESIRPEKLHGHVLILNVILPTINKLFTILKEHDLPHFLSITLVTADSDLTEEQIKAQYKVIKAAGGVVRNEKGNLLLMYRLKKWDLPKGKLDKGEKSKNGAVREVEEECNVKVRLEEKICTTFHTYTYKNEHILKQTKWYSMEIVDDSKMKPQIEEDIEKLEWMDRKQIHTALINSYSSIRYVVKRYFYESEDKWEI